MAGIFFSLRAIATLGLCLLLFACATPSTQVPTTNVAAEQAAIRLIASGGLPPARNLSDYGSVQLINKISSRLNPSANRICRYLAEHGCSWNVRYSNDPGINAFADGQSRIVIQKGIVQATRNDEELAFVVAHEMSHHIANHISETAQNAMVGGILMGILGAYAGKDYYDPAASQQLIQESASLGMAIGARSYSKQQELEADYLAAYIVSLAGYDLNKAGQVLVTLGRANAAGVYSYKSFLGTHPSGPQRVAAWRAVQREIAFSTRKLPVKR